LTVTLELLRCGGYSQCGGGLWDARDRIQLQKHAANCCLEADAIRRTARNIFSHFFAKELAARSIQAHRHHYHHHHQQQQQHVLPVS